MARRRNFLVGALVGFATTAAYAAESGSTSAETVVVTAARNLDAATVTAQAPQFVESRTGLTPIKQVPRWRAPVCPKVEGLPPAFNAFISNRMTAITEKAGALVDKSCKTNIEVMFTADPQTLANDMADKTPWLFGTHLSTSARHLATVTRPIQAWYVTATIDPSGQQRTDDPSNAVGVTGSNRKVFGSRLGENKASVFENIVIVADSAKIAGHDVGTVADYIALLALTEVQSSDGCAALPSVTDAMSSGCGKQPAPDSITQVDMEFLKALYATQGDALGTLARADIARRISQGLPGN
jgi:hypothetical protein